MSDGSPWDGLNLRELVRTGQSPFAPVWDVHQLNKEIEQNTGHQINDALLVECGSNNYGFHMTTVSGYDIVARLSRGDINMPGFAGPSLESQIAELNFEVAVYTLLHNHMQPKRSRLLYHRAPAKSQDNEPFAAQNIMGRRLMVFDRNFGKTRSVWGELDNDQQLDLLAQAATLRASLFNFQLPLEFASKYMLDRLFEQKPQSLPLSVAPTRDFCIALFTSKIEGTIRNVGEMIGWESDNNFVGPVAAAAKQSLLRFVPTLLPEQDSSEALLYRLILEHGDFGIHNMTITDTPTITSLFDWETGCIVPALLSDTFMAVGGADLITSVAGRPALKRICQDAPEEKMVQAKACTKRYHEVLFEKAPEYRKAIEAGRDARYLWFALRDWRGDDPEGYFGALGEWAETEMEEGRV